MEEIVVTEKDRDAAVRRLRDAYADGHVTHEEMDGLLHRLLTAGTRGELRAALATLPEEDPGTTAEIAAAAGRIRRRGPWQVPRTLKVQSALGHVRLDLSRAIIEHPVVDIEVRLGTGRATITVPRDAIVDVEELATGWKAPLYRPRRRSGGAAGPTIRITGAMGLGRLRIRHARR
ncbi:DUF1707 domain-containing protein [Nonomuraea sp. NPDC049725]|uniref:DUF1707 SHOCT-like domain-containing protein n=1 Tax=Nonomuraea sp. NPDC049725 TaxID=3154508 RepID=UPI0034126B53